MSGSARFGRDWLAVAWFGHRRLESITARLGIPCHVLKSRRHRVLRYCVLAARTLRLVARERPRFLLVQNPSIASAILCALLRRVFGFVLVIDAHNEAVVPYNHPGPVVRRLAAWLLRTADVTIVTNGALARIVAEAGGRPFELYDPIPVPPDGAATVPVVPRRVAVISTYAADEPLQEIIAAARLLQGADVEIRITGRPSQAFLARAGDVPANVVLTGFLVEAEYWALLASAAIVVDLTRMPSCLVCGAYEALALGRPMLLTDDEAGRALFGEAALFTDNVPESIAAQIVALIERQAEFEPAARRLAARLSSEWEQRAQRLEAFTGERARRDAPAMRPGAGSC